MIVVYIALGLLAVALVFSILAARRAGAQVEAARAQAEALRADLDAARRQCAEAVTRATVAEQAAAQHESEAAERLAAQQRAADTLLAARMADAERRLDEARQGAEERLAELRESFENRLRQEREALGERFKSLAAEVLGATSKTADERSRSTIEAVLAPVRTSLEEFTKNFRDAYSAENTERLSLRENLRSLADLNRQVSDEARRLAQALHGNTRWQGKWGELVLQNILEASGLEQGRCLQLQKGVRDDEGEQLRPDAVIICPDRRKIIIDSKVSLVDYLKFTQTYDEAARAELLKAHVRAIEAHVAELRDKRYQDRMDLQATDFVLMFVPHEGAFIAAVETQPELWMRAFDSRVVIVSPAHLVTVVKLIEQMWRVNDRNENAATIAAEAGKLLEKLNGFLKDMGNVADALDRARSEYDKAISKLSTGRGSVLSRAVKMRRLGAKAGPLPDRYLKDLDADADADTEALPEHPTEE